MVNLFSLSLSPFEAWEKNIHFSFSSQKSRICFQISLSLLKVGEQHFKFLCLFSKMVNLFSLSLSHFEAWEKNIPFSFSSRKLRIFFQISLSLLKTGERIVRFLLLLSKLEKIISNCFFSSRLDFLASRHTLALMQHNVQLWRSEAGAYFLMLHTLLLSCRPWHRGLAGCFKRNKMFKHRRSSAAWMF